MKRSVAVSMRIISLFEGTKGALRHATAIVTVLNVVLLVTSCGLPSPAEHRHFLIC